MYVLVYDFGPHCLPLFLIHIADSFAFKENVDHVDETLKVADERLQMMETSQIVG